MRFVVTDTKLNSAVLLQAKDEQSALESYEDYLRQHHEMHVEAALEHVDENATAWRVVAEYGPQPVR